MDQRNSRLLFYSILASAISTGQLFAIAPFSFAQSPTAPLYSGRTQDSAPIALAMQDKDAIIRFKIPKAYMTLSPNWAGGMQDVIALEVEFPSMLPAGKKSLAAPEVLAISLYSFANTGADYDVSRSLERNLREEWFLVGKETERAGQDYRIYVARSDVEKWKNPDASVREYLVPSDPVAGPIFFGCYRERANPFAGCTSATNFGRTLSLEISFRRSQLQSWPAIVHAAKGLLTSFKE